MRDLETKLQQLETDAADCDLIAKLAVEDDKRAMFAELAHEYRRMAERVRAVIVVRQNS